MDLGADRRGVDMGPSAIRYAGLDGRLDELGHEVADAGNVAVPPPETREPDAGPPPEGHAKYLEETAEVSRRLREEFMMARQAGDATNEDLRELQRTQQELHEKPKMAAYLRAQSELELRLQELDEIISEPLEVDFGQTAGGCCED